MVDISSISATQKYAYIIRVDPIAGFPPDEAKVVGTYVITGEFESHFALELFHTVVKFDRSQYETSITSTRRFIEVTTIAQFGPDLVIEKLNI